MLQNIFVIIQIILSVVLTALILVQSRGSGMGRTFGGSSVSFTRRGVEQVVFRSTFIVAGLFILISILSIAL